MMRMEVEPQHHHYNMDQSEATGKDGKNQKDGKEGIEEEQDPFMSVPVEVVFHILACLVLPAPTPSRGDRFGGPYEAAVESAVQLLRLPLVSKWWREMVKAEEQVLWTRAWQALCMSLPRGCYDAPPLSRVPLALQVARLALRRSPSSVGLIGDTTHERTPKDQVIEHLQILKRRRTGKPLSVTNCKSQLSGQCDIWNGLAVHVSPHGFLIYDLESGELQRGLLVPWGKVKGKALCAVFRPNGKSVHILGLAFTDLNSRALQLHVFDLETASPLHRAELIYNCGVTYFPECSLSPSGRWLCAFSPGRALLLWDMHPLYKAIADAPSSVQLPLRHHLMHQQPDPDGGADVYGDCDSDDNDISLIRSLACIPALVEDHQADMFRFTLTRDRYAVATFAGPDRPGATQVNIMQLVPHSKPVQVGHAVVPRPRIEQLAVDSRLLAACIEDSDVLLFRYADDLPREAADCVGANRRKRPKLESCGGEGMKDKNPGDTTLELVMIEQPLRIAASFYSPPQPRIFTDEWSMYYLADFRRPEDYVGLQFSVDAAPINHRPRNLLLLLNHHHRRHHLRSHCCCYNARLQLRPGLLRGHRSRSGRSASGPGRPRPTAG